MGKCMVVWCNNRSNNKPPGISFHRISTTQEQYELYLRAIGRQQDHEALPKDSRICSAHFTPDCFENKGSKKLLRADAFPTLNLKPDRATLRAQVTFNTDIPAPSCSSHRDEPPSSNVETTIATSSEIGGTSVGILPGKRAVAVSKQVFHASSTSDSEGLRGSPKRRRRQLKTEHSYCMSPRSLKRKYDQTIKEKNEAKKRMYNFHRNVTRLQKRVDTLENVIEDLRENNMVTDDACSVLEKSFSGIPLQLMRRALSNLNKGKPNTEKFPPELRSFAMTLQFFSAQAYEYVRNTFHLALPASSVIRSWMSSIECEPGFLGAAFNTLKSKAQENSGNNIETLVSLCLDEMAIRKQIEFVNNRTWGYVDLGTDIDDDQMVCASEALVLMVVAVNGHWKIPIAYFFIKSLTGKEKANIVKEAIHRLSDIGVTTVSVTCDGPAAHFTMANELGAKIDDMQNLITYFKSPVDDSKIYIIFDACHMLKLIRNSWASLGTFKDQQNREIKFAYIQLLQEVQDSESCRIANKLRRAHIKWEQQKMKVNLAAQLLSKSVADAIEFMMTDMKHPLFLNAKATVDFLRVVNDLFDLCNSRNLFAKGCKGPLKEANEHYWRSKFEESIRYLKNLTTSDGTPLYSTRQKTPIKGFIITALSLIGIYESYVKPAQYGLKYLLSYKMSQDHLELLFCQIRSRSGANNNPTAFQFRNTIRRLLVHQQVHKYTGNCAAQDDTSILNVTSFNKKQSRNPTYTIDDISYMRQKGEDNSAIDLDYDHDYFGFDKPLSLISENVLIYIAGFVVKKLKQILKCSICLGVLEEVTNTTLDDYRFKLITRKNRGGLINPSSDVIEIVKFTEIQLRNILIKTKNQLPNEKYFFEKFSLRIALQLISEDKYFRSLSDHVFDNSTFEDSHLTKLIKLIVSIYLKIKFNFISKEQSYIIKGDAVRKTLSKLVLFRHQ